MPAVNSIGSDNTAPIGKLPLAAPAVIASKAISEAVSKPKPNNRPSGYLYAHRNYAKSHGLPNDLKAMNTHTLIGYDRDQVLIRAMVGMGIQIERERFELRCDSELAQLSALRAGFGIGACQTDIARRDPDLIPVLPDQVSFSLDMWLAMHRDLKSSRCVALLFENLSRMLTKYLAAVSDHISQ